jgi:hypothetical protein
MDGLYPLALVGLLSVRDAVGGRRLVPDSTDESRRTQY